MLKIFDGLQFQNKKPIKEPINTHTEAVLIKDAEIKITIIVNVSIPSIPSIKLQKFIIAVKKIVNIEARNILRKSLLILKIKSIKFALNKITKEVVNCVINLSHLLRLKKSSNKHIKQRGIRNKKLFPPIILVMIKFEKIKVIPPPLGLMERCKLLLFGISGINFLNGLTVILVRYQFVIRPEIIFKSNSKVKVGFYLYY